jgi:ADP-ribosylglycohydrolase
MQASANLGGDAACRTALVGAIMGAMHGYTSVRPAI